MNNVLFLGNTNYRIDENSCVSIARRQKQIFNSHRQFEMVLLLIQSNRIGWSLNTSDPLFLKVFTDGFIED